MTRCFVTGIAILVATSLGTAQGAFLTGTGGAPAAIPGGTVIDFDSATPGLYSSITLSGVTFASGTIDPISIGPDFNGLFNTRGTQSLFNDFDHVPDKIVITFSSVVSAFAFNWGAADNIWTIEAFDSASALIESDLMAAVFGSNAGDYYGISAAGIKSVVLTDTHNNILDGDYVFVDDFTFADVRDVPEPSSLAIACMGLVTAVGLRRRRKV